MKVEHDFENLTHILTITAETRMEEDILEDFSKAKGECKPNFERHSTYKRALLTITRVT